MTLKMNLSLFNKKKIKEKIKLKILHYYNDILSKKLKCIFTMTY